MLGLHSRTLWQPTGSEARGGSGRELTRGRLWPNQVNRGGAECVGKAAQGRGPRLGPQSLQPDQGIAADAGAVGQLLLGQGSLETTAPEAAEGDHGRREWMVAGVTPVVATCTVDVTFMTTSVLCHGVLGWQCGGRTTPAGTPRRMQVGSERCRCRCSQHCQGMPGVRPGYGWGTPRPAQWPE
jgi:hypothetical protein